MGCSLNPKYLEFPCIQIILTETTAVSMKEVFEALEDKLEIVAELRGAMCTGAPACTRAQQECGQAIIGQTPCTS